MFQSVFDQLREADIHTRAVERALNRMHVCDTVRGAVTSAASLTRDMVDLTAIATDAGAGSAIEIGDGIRPPPVSPVVSALALLYKHHITKGAAMEGDGGVADIAMLDFPSDIKTAMVTRGCLLVYMTATHQLSKPSSTARVLRELRSCDPSVWSTRETFLQAVDAVEDLHPAVGKFEATNLIPPLCRQTMAPSVVRSWAETEGNWRALVTATDKLATLLPIRKEAEFDGNLAKQVADAFKPVRGVGKYTALRLFRSCCIVFDVEPPLGDDWYGFDTMSAHEKTAFESLGVHGKSPAVLAEALDQCGVDVQSFFGLLVAVCEMHSVCKLLAGNTSTESYLKQLRTLTGGEGVGGQGKCVLMGTLETGSLLNMLRGGDLSEVRRVICSFLDPVSVGTEWKRAQLAAFDPEHIVEGWTYHSAVSVVRGLLKKRKAASKRKTGAKRKR
jgi:hypothetical protein